MGGSLVKGLHILLHLFPGDIRQDNDEFISSCPEYILHIEYLPECACRILQKPVPVLMSPCIVDFLKSVQIGEKDPHGCLLAVRKLPEEAHVVVHLVAVHHAGQHVPRAKLFEFVHHQMVSHLRSENKCRQLKDLLNLRGSILFKKSSPHISQMFVVSLEREQGDISDTCIHQ